MTTPTNRIIVYPLDSGWRVISKDSSYEASTYPTLGAAIGSALTFLFKNGGGTLGLKGGSGQIKWTLSVNEGDIDTQVPPEVQPEPEAYETCLAYPEAYPEGAEESCADFDWDPENTGGTGPRAFPRGDEE